MFYIRSPGGTPLKQESLPCDVNDHAAVFARALKRKFSLCPVGSPDSEKENNTPVRLIIVLLISNRSRIQYYYTCCRISVKSVKRYCTMAKENLQYRILVLFQPGPHLLKKVTANRKLLRRSKPLANVTNS